ncbi:membrane protein [Arthrobacter phage Tokki]|nr:membrane protein [Arthrobacter phage Tokki]
MSAGKAVALVIGGALVGSGVTIMVLKKKYEAKAEEEIASVRDSYLKRLNEMEEEFDAERKKNGYVPEEVPTEEDIPEELPKERVVPTTNELRTAYHKMHRPANPETVEGLKETNETLGYSRKEEEPVKATVMSYREGDSDTPYVIPVQAYMDNEELFEQYTLTYYAGDKTLVIEDSDEVIEDIDQTVGFHNLHNFGVDSGNDDTVYVRNPKKEAEYEILRDEGKYHEKVQGVDTWDDTPEPREPIRKFRG